jgi:YYY domain-containing protein
MDQQDGLSPSSGLRSAVCVPRRVAFPRWAAAERKGQSIPDWLSESARWYLALMAATWALAPLARWVFGNMPDRGATVSRPMALLAVIWPTWFLAAISPVPFTTVGLWLTVAAFGVAGWYLAWQSGWVTREWLRALLVVEGLSLLAFSAYVGLRGYTPEITFTEQPMDVAFLTSSTMTEEIPPADPWLAGEPINYYYLGYLAHATVGRLAGVPTWSGYNLALAATASMAFIAAAGVAFNAVYRAAGRRWAIAAATLAGFLAVLAGNMHAVIEFLRDRQAAVDQGWWGTIGWSSSRIIVDGDAQTINEFPWFSLLLGDLHPHLTALPFTMLAIALALNLLFLPRTTPASQWLSYALLILTGAVVGALYPLNSLDFPTYLVVMLGALAIRHGLTRVALIQGGVVAVSAIAFWLPFTVRFVPFAGIDDSGLPGWLRDIPLLSRVFTTISWHDGERTSVSEFLTVFGLFWAISVAFLLWQAVASLQESPLDPRASRWIIAGGLVVAIAAVTLPAPVVLLAGLPLAMAIWLLTPSRRSGDLARVAATALFAAAWGLVVLTEFFYVQDVFSGRYNTLFKVYYQAWTMLAIGSAIGASVLIRALARQPLLQGAAVAALATGLLLAAAYPAIATPQWTRVHGPRDWQGLDGAAYMARHSAGDLAAIRWLYDNAEPGDVIIEAPGCSYQIYEVMPTSRMSAFTGVPAIIGWDGHESQWRAGQPELMAELGPRQGDVAAIYADPASPLVDEYDATLLMVGSFEQRGAGSACERAGPYPATAAPGFPGAGWEEVFSSGETTIYRREHDPLRA